MTIFAFVQLAALAAATFFCIAGWGLSQLRRRRDRLRSEAYDLAALLVLADEADELERAGKALAARPTAVIADVLSEVAMDVYGESRRRLRLTADESGLTRTIARWSRSRSWRRRSRAAHLLILLSSGAPERSQLLADRHPLVRARAIESLERGGVGRYASVLLDAFDHDSPAVRAAAQHALARGGVDCVPPIIQLLNRLDRGKGDARTVRLVAEVAAQLPDERLVQALLRFVSHPDPSLRVLVASCLGNGTVAEPALHLHALLHDGDAAVRAEAARSVGRGDVGALAHVLGERLADPSWHVRRNSGAALLELGPIGTVILRCHVDDEDAFARDMALHSLGRVSRLGDVLANRERWVAAA